MSDNSMRLSTRRHSGRIVFASSGGRGLTLRATSANTMPNNGFNVTRKCWQGGNYDDTGNILSNWTRGDIVSTAVTSAQIKQMDFRPRTKLVINARVLLHSKHEDEADLRDRFYVTSYGTMGGSFS
ncbi:hypothetical protein K0M31_017212 [Melipona bicolor]|uniref:Uncharacterized protein n=1 Tax=Melipona bicolor TaxID=60889 RepID=A0AA40G557_9HYME|nr:hypothetical protein K0M31_017212 [Melipona bicolor]